MKKAPILLFAVLCICLAGCQKAFQWPDNEFTKGLPVPECVAFTGEGTEPDYVYSIDLVWESYDQCVNYINLLENSGYKMTDSFFLQEIGMWVGYKSGDKYMVSVSFRNSYTKAEEGSEYDITVTGTIGFYEPYDYLLETESEPSNNE